MIRGLEVKSEDVCSAKRWLETVVCWMSLSSSLLSLPLSEKAEMGFELEV